MNKKTFICFLVPYAVFAIIWFLLIVIYEKGELHLMLNVYRSSFLDFFSPILLTWVPASPSLLLWFIFSSE